MPTENENPAVDTAAEESTPAAEKPSYMTAAEFNKAVTAREKRTMERIEKLLSEKLSAFAPKPADTDDDLADEPAAGTQTAGSTAPKDDMERKLRSLERQLSRERNEREKREAADRDKDAKIARDEERSRLNDALAAAGVDPKKIRGAVALLHTEDKRVRRNEDGRIVFVDENEDEFDLSTGVKNWISSDEGKGYMPARGAQGSGAEPGRITPKSGTQKGNKPSKELAMQSLAYHMLRPNS